MSYPPDPLNPRSIIRERELADRWDKSVRFMQRFRKSNLGPPWFRIGASVYYRLSDVYAFECAKIQDAEGAR